jgi:hypothetical protein
LARSQAPRPAADSRLVVIQGADHIGSLTSKLGIESILKAATRD